MTSKTHGQMGRGDKFSSTSVSLLITLYTHFKDKEKTHSIFDSAYSTKIHTSDKKNNKKNSDGYQIRTKRADLTYSPTSI